MSILQRYVIRELLAPLGLGLVVFTFVMLVSQLFKLIGLILTSGLDGKLIGELILLLLPGILSLTVPMAVLVAVLLGIGRLTADREILAMRTSGVNLWHITFPIILMAAALSGTMIYANMKLIPYLNLKSADVETQLEFNVLSAIPPGEAFTLPGSDGMGDTSIFYSEKEPETGDLLQVNMRSIIARDSEQAQLRQRERIVEALLLALAKDGLTTVTATGETTVSVRQQKDWELVRRRHKDAEIFVKAEQAQHQDVLILAERAKIDPNISERVLTFNLTSGSLHISNPEQPSAYDIVQFDEFSKGYVPRFDKTESGVFERDPQEMTAKELRKLTGTERDKNNRYSIELLQRFAIPLACISFALIAIPLGIYVRPTGKALAFGMAFIVILIYYGLLQYGLALASKDLTIGTVAIFLPNIVLAFAGGLMLYRMVMK